MLGLMEEYQCYVTNRYLGHLPTCTDQLDDVQSCSCTRLLKLSIKVHFNETFVPDLFHLEVTSYIFSVYVDVDAQEESHCYL